MSLVSFLPLDQRESLHTRGRPIEGLVSGCALLADLVGSTRILESFVQALGPSQAAEALGGLLNRLFSRMVERIHAYRGSVTHFGGDALTAWFPRGQEAGALCCALEIRDLLEQGSPDPFLVSEVATRFRMTLCSGEVLRCVVGAPEIQRMDVLVGPLMTRLSRINARTSPGEVTVDAGFEGVLRDLSADAQGLPDFGDERAFVVRGVPRPVPAQEPASEEGEFSPTERWVHPDVEARLQALRGAFLDEMREVAVLFLLFEGLDYLRDSEAAMRLDRIVRHTQKVFEHYEGLLLQVVPGDKGDYLYGCFGAPVAHEDDGERLLLGALDLLRFPPEAGLSRPPAIGVSRGFSYAGAYGSPRRRTYGVLGREVVRAARLMERAESGQILAPASLLEKVSGFQATPPILISMKGFDQPCAVVQVTGRSLRGATTFAVQGDPLEGREEEIQLLRRQLDAVRIRREGGLVVLEGVPGIGKTRLAGEIVSLARQSGFRVLWGCGEALGSESPYHTWRPVFEDLLRGEAGPGEDSRAVLERLVTRIGHPPGWSRLLDMWFPFSGPEDPEISSMSPEVRADNTRLVLLGMLGRALAGTPALVVLEDLHWFDQTSIQFLKEALRHLPEVLFLVLSRPLGSAPGGFGELLEGAARRIFLEPLTGEQVAQLACRRLRAERLHPDLRRWLVEHTGGNPLVVREVVLNLRETGVVEVQQGVASITRGDPESMPCAALSLREVFISRVDRLEPEAQAILKVASVIGSSFPAGAIAPLLTAQDQKEHPGDRVREVLKRLVEEEFLVPDPRGAEGIYQFQHALLREAVYGTLLGGQRRALHEAVARWWEAQGEEARAPLEVLAWHWQEAGDRERALDYLDIAADRALQRFANDIASSLFSWALAILGPESRDLDRRARLELGLGIARVNLLRFAEATENLTSGLGLLGCAMPRGSLGQQGALLLEVLRHLTLRLFPPRTENRTEGERERMRIVVRALERLSELYYIRAMPTAAYLAGFRMINWAMRTGPCPELARAHASFGAGIGFIPLHRAAPFYFRQATALLDRYGDPATENYVSFMEGFYRLGTGAFAETERLLRRSLDLSIRLGDERRQADALSQLVPLHMFRGDVEEARRCAERMIAISRDRAYLRNLAEALYLRGWVRLMTGEIEPGAHDIEELQELLLASPKTEDPFLALGVRAGRAYLAFLRGDHEVCLRYIREAMDRARDYQPNFASALPAFFLPGDLFYRLGRRGVSGFSVRDLRQAVRLARGFGRVFPVGRSGALRVEGEVAWVRGRIQRAVVLLRSAASEARRIGMVLDELQALLSLAEILPDDDPEKGAVLDRAQSQIPQSLVRGPLRNRLERQQQREVQG